MQLRSTMIGIVLLGLCLTAGPAEPQEKKDDYAAPGAVHQQLAKRAGEYTTTSKFSFKPGMPPTESAGTAKLTSILGGRFLKEESTGTMMGQAYSSLHLEGYNSATNKFEATWAYTGSTSLMSLVGTSKDGGKTIEYVATFDSGKEAKQALQVTTRVLDDDHFVTELVAKNADGSKGPTLETAYTRKK